MKDLYLLILLPVFLSIDVFAGPEGTGKPLDLSAPNISYNSFSISNCLTGKSFSATITDNDGVNITAGTRPRVYYKKSTDLNQWNNNTSATHGWKYTEATNTTSPFTFNIDYALLHSGGVSAGNTIQYFVVAQDLAATPNIAIKNGNFSLSPSTVALTAANFPIGGSPNSYNIVSPLGTTLTVGLLGNYTSLTGANGLFNAINTHGLSGNTTVTITDALVLENGDVGLDQINATGCANANYSLLIKPSGLATVLVGNFDGTLIRILSNNVTIDGSFNGGTSRNLTITNANLFSPSVILMGSTGTTPIINSTLKNTTIINGINTVNPVVISDGDNPGSPGYFNNITIQNNSIQTGYVGVFCLAVPTPGNGSVLITGNDMNLPGANSIRLVPIYAQGLDGGVFSNNNLGNILNLAEMDITGIWLSIGTVNCTVSGNTISSINGTVGASRGIVVSSGVANANINISNNIINTLSTSSQGVTSGILVFNTTGGVNIQKNTIYGISNSNLTSSGCNGIQLSSSLTAADINVQNNFIYDVSGFGKAGAEVTDNGYGIVVTSGAGYNIDHNSVNLNTDQTVAGTTAAINITSGVDHAGTINLRNNIFANNQTILSGLNTRYAIYSGAANTAFGTINNNDYYSAGPNPANIGGIDRPDLFAIQSGFGDNEYSTTVRPNFTSATNLHLTAANNCRLEGYGAPLAAVSTDMDNQARHATAPDIGADEFTATPVANSITTSSGCDAKNMLAGITKYIDGTCNLIASINPTGASPVSGPVNTCVTLDATQQYFNGQPYVRRHYDIEPVNANQTTTTATITLYFTNAEFVNYNSVNPVYPPLPTLAGGGNIDPNKANVKITQFHGAATASPSTPGNYPGTKVLIIPDLANIIWNGTFWEITFNITGFSGFYVHTNVLNAPLPIAVNYLNGYKQGNNHLLNWKVTCAGTPRVTMQLERSADGRNYSTINTITADAARCAQPFDHTDANPLKGMNYYRLKNTDVDGYVTYSTTIALLNAVKGFDMTVSPNPVVGDEFKLNVASAQAGNMHISIFDMQGRLVQRQAIALIAGFNNVPVKVDNLPAGSYTIRGNTTGEEIKIIRFVKQ
jgi:Secretion system C-terminal sorting domain